MMLTDSSARWGLTAPRPPLKLPPCGRSLKSAAKSHILPRKGAVHRRARYARVPGYAIPKGECPVNLRRAGALATLGCPRSPSARSLRSLPSLARFGVRVGCSLVASLLYLSIGGLTSRPGACSRLRLLLPHGRCAAGSTPFRQPCLRNSRPTGAR